MPQQHLADINYAAQAILARRDHSEAELARKLSGKGFRREEIAATIAKLKKIKLVNDSEFSRRYTESLLLAKPIGPRLLRAKLQQKGVGGDRIADTLADAFPPGREEELARAAAAAWRRSHPKHAADKARLFRYLTARGFSVGAIQATGDIS